MNIDRIRRQFIQKHGDDPRIFRAPGRVNLIGEHTDYNNGFVLPVAIDMAVHIAVSPRNDRIVHVSSTDFPGDHEFSLDDSSSRSRSWVKYVQGAAILLDNVHPIRGANLLIESSIPVGAGLSSSAALEMAVAYSLSTISGAHIDNWTLVKIGQATEHVYAGVKGGILDQFSSMFGREDHAILLDCRSFDWTPIPFRSIFVVCNTKTKHDLAESQYNVRRAECEEAAARLGAQSLREVTPNAFESGQERLPSNLLKRARHVLTENDRVQQAAKALERSDLYTFGQMMNESHESLRSDFEVSCVELDAMVEITRRQEGVIGARMTGGGFGGCTIALFESDVPPDFVSLVASEYRQALGIEPEFHICKSTRGVSEIADG